MAARKQLWYDLQREDAGVALCALAAKYKQQASTRKARATSLLSLYEGLTLGRLDSSAYDTAEPYQFLGSGDRPDEPSELVWNLGASIMDSIDAKLFALDKVKTKFVVTDGGWDIKRAAELASRFIDGQMHEPQGIFPDLWALWRHAGRLALTATGTSAVFFWSDPDEGKIVAELDDTLNMFVETSGLPYDGISSVGRITAWDPDKLAARFPGTENEAKIWAAAEKPDNDLAWAGDADDAPDEVRRVPLVQGWRMKAPGVPGKLCYAIPGATLAFEDYAYDFPPCVFFNPYRQLAGFWGRAALERIVVPLRRMNEILSALDDAERLSPKGTLTFDPTTIPKSSIETIKNVVLLPYTGAPGREPKYAAPPPFHPLVLELLKLHKDACFDLIGMSEAQVTASREKGLSSGVAIRLLQNQSYERFAPVEDEFTRCEGPDSAKQIMRCAQEIHKGKGGGFKAIWKGSGDGGFLKEIDATVFDTLEKEGKYRVQAEAVSGSADTPADRVQLAEELMQAGIITGEAYASILQTFDTPGEAKGAQSLDSVTDQFVKQQIDGWLYDSLDDAKKNYEGPDKWMNTPKLLLQVGSAYTSAKMAMRGDKDSSETTQRLGLFFRFMSTLEEHMKEKTLRTQANSQAGVSGPTAPAMPGAAQSLAPMQPRAA
jgi:hypothetical protein